MRLLRPLFDEMKWRENSNMHLQKVNWHNFGCSISVKIAIFIARESRLGKFKKKMSNFDQKYTSAKLHFHVKKGPKWSKLEFSMLEIGQTEKLSTF